MKKNIKLKVSERIVRNNRGDLALRYITALAPAEKIDVAASLSQLAKELGITPERAGYALDVVGSMIGKSILEGRPVTLRGLGTFRPGLRSKAATSRSKAGAAAVERVVVNYLPDLQLRRRLAIENLAFRVAK